MKWACLIAPIQLWPPVAPYWWVVPVIVWACCDSPLMTITRQHWKGKPQQWTGLLLYFFDFAGGGNAKDCGWWLVESCSEMQEKPVKGCCTWSTVSQRCLFWSPRQHPCAINEPRKFSESTAFIIRQRNGHRQNANAVQSLLTNCQYTKL